MRDTKAPMEALEWYAEQAEAIARHSIIINETALMAIVTTLSLDAGQRAKKAIAALAHPGDAQEDRT